MVLGTSLKEIFYIVFVALIHIFVAGRLNVYFVGETAVEVNMDYMSIILLFNFIIGISMFVYCLVKKKSTVKALGTAVLSIGIFFFMLWIPEFATNKESFFVKSDNPIHYVMVVPVVVMAYLQTILLRNR